MSDPGSLQTENAGLVTIAWDAFKWIAGACIVWTVHLFRKQRSRVARLEKRIEDVDTKIITLPLEIVSRETFNLHERDTRDAIDSLRREAREREDRIITAVNNMGEKLHARIDTLFRGGK